MRQTRPRELVLIICFVLLLLMFSVTALVSRLYHKKIHTLADQWFAQGEAAFHAADARSAISDYHNALVYSPNNSIFQLHLAQALAAAGRLDEARSYLINLLAESPGNGEINLEFARISAREGARLDAVRYYHSAIYGVWDADPWCSAGTCARSFAGSCSTAAISPTRSRKSSRSRRRSHPAISSAERKQALFSFAPGHGRAPCRSSSRF